MHRSTSLAPLPGASAVDERFARMRLRPQDPLIPAVSLVDLAEIVWRRRWPVVAIVFLSVALTMGYLMLIRGDLYVAEAKLLVRIGQEQAPSPTMIDRSMMVGAQPGQAAPEVEMLRSRDLIEALVDRIDLTPAPRPPPTTLFGIVRDFAKRSWTKVKDAIDDAMIWLGLKPRLSPREVAIEAISRALAVESPVNSNLFTARVFWPQRGAPEAMLKLLVDLYLERRALLFQGTTAANFFTERRRETSLRLQDAEEALSAFERLNGIANPDEQRGSLLRRLSDAETGLDAARLDVRLAETALSQLDAARARGDEELAAFAVAQYGSGLQQTLAGELAQAASRLLAAQTTLSPQDLTIRRLQASMLALSRAMAQQQTATLEQRRAQLALRETQRDTIRAELDRLQMAVGEWQELRRSVASALRAYEFNDGKLNEATGIAALETARLGNVVVIQSASEQAGPVGIRKSTMLMLAAGGGLMLALTWVVLSEFFDHRMKGPADVERRLGLRVLGAVPLDRKGIGMGKAPSADADAVLARTAAALGRFTRDEGMRVLVVTAGVAGEGASTVSVQVGRQMAGLLGLRVLLVDLGGPRPGLVEQAAGLAVAPVRVVPDGRRSWQDLLSVAGSGWAVADLGRQGAPLRELDALLAAAREAFDLVLIDAPPWQGGPESLLAIRACSHVMLVAAAGNLTWDVLERVCADLEAEQVVMVGCVLNRYRRHLPRWLQGLLQ